ncbi:MAG: type II toxin-antitoxin system RelE/ParE family toxin [Verrucomicrobia bacterium]|nr:type II toxin-antitoxin system RelE/ParE family toxin [Verrucomicrobiota bacterium]MBS0637866.1 type II toxin-antitoxin system RelE/ParE family toxin [Verrucomicrobiota bacterium]
MIQSFANRGTEDIYHGNNSKQARSVLPTNLFAQARRKLDMINAAEDIKDLREPPGNRLEELRGNLEGMHSIRINEQWRIIFYWSTKGAEVVEIVDYHK